MNLQDKYWDKAHNKNPNDYQYARIVICAPDPGNLHEITLTHIKTLNYNGAWDFLFNKAKGCILSISFAFSMQEVAFCISLCYNVFRA